MAIEMVVLVPVLFAFVLLIVAGGRLVLRQGEIDSAARDAARAASVARSYGDASSAAQRAVAATIEPGVCDPVSMSGSDFVAGGRVVVSIACRVPLGDIGLVGLPGSITVHGESTAPLDVYRRT